jgi:hypothetical protein
VQQKYFLINEHNYFIFKAICFKSFITFFGQNAPLPLDSVAAKIQISTNASTDAKRVLRSLD